jgi:prepilin-type N-terminal cleavage/methylation domain-containing protein
VRSAELEVSLLTSAATGERGRRAFSLIELVGVLAVLAVLAAAAVPALIRQLDRIAGEQESAALRSLSDALQQSILRKRYIPSGTDWATNIASELGVVVANVTTSPRRQPRFFLVDANLKVGDNNSGLPYDQTARVFGSVVTNNTGVIIPPVSPRVMILSSIGRALPAGISNGVASSANFNAIWDRNDTGNALPTTSFTWTGWPDGDDLKVQRVNLSPLFVRLILTTNVSESGYYCIDTSSTNNVPSPGRDGYFVRNTVLRLFLGLNKPDSQQILTRDTSYVYEQNIWRSSLTGGSFLAGSLDLGSVVDKYLDAPENTNAMNTTFTNSSRYTGISQQSVVVSNMIAYMKAYTNWAASGFTDNGLRNTAINIQLSMKAAVQNQYAKDTGNNNYLPNPTACPP